MKKSISIMGIVLISMAIVSGIDGNDLERIAQSVVMVIPVDIDAKGSFKPIGTSGSGTLVDAGKGIVLTNHHVVWDQEKSRVVKTALVFVTVTLENPPVPSFLCEVTSYDEKADLAALKIVKTLPSAPIKLGALDAFDRGDAEEWAAVTSLKLNDDVHVMGYPGYEYNSGKPVTLTVTNGKVAGFVNDPDFPAVTKAWIKTDALTSWGNSGGTAIDSKGRFIGVPTQVMLDPKGGRIGLLRPSDMGIPFIVSAESYKPGSVARNDTAKIASLAKAVNPRFASSRLKDKMPADPGFEFPAEGTGSLYVYFDYSGFENGAKCNETWFKDRKKIASRDFDWSWDDKGTWYSDLSHDSGSLPSGQYSFVLFVEGRELVSTDATLFDRSTPGVRGSVTASGSVKDSATGRGIPGARVLILKKGVTVAQFMKDKDEALILASGVSGLSGGFACSGRLARGESYGVVVVASGYRTLSENGVAVVAKDGDDQLVLTVTLKKTR